MTERTIELIDFDVKIRIPEGGFFMRTIKVPAWWSNSIKEWILTGDAIRLIEKERDAYRTVKEEHEM